jgi:N-acetylglucosamine kinase-like BadF-type ATPase
MAEQHYVLGIFGGSTKTDAVLVTMDGTLVAEECADLSDLGSVLVIGWYFGSKFLGEKELR